jgi:hypothetical protein
MSAGWGNKAVIVDKARLEDEIRKRGLRISELEEQIGRVMLLVGQDWRGHYATDLVDKVLGSLGEKP